MAHIKLPKQLRRTVEGAVAAYKKRRQDFANLAKRVENDLVENEDLRSLIHSTKRREKDPAHLHDKLLRKALAGGKKFDITAANVFDKIGDLAGVRLLHIHMEQLQRIHPKIIEILGFHKYTLREKPVAFIWDAEREAFMKTLGLEVEVRPGMYTSVHYVVEPHWGRDACEIQVRTLAEELWSEVSHTVDYPHHTESVACREQLAALARVASGCTRLVDSIFASLDEHKELSR